MLVGELTGGRGRVCLRSEITEVLPALPVTTYLRELGDKDSEIILSRFR